MTDAPSWDPRLTAWLDRVEVAWVDAGLNLVDRGELRSRLVQDLAQAVQQGAPVAELVAADPTSFAADVAAASGVTEAPAPTGVTAPDRSRTAAPTRAAVRTNAAPWSLTRRVRFVVAALVGALVGSVASFYLIQHAGYVITNAMWVTLGQRAEGVLFLGGYAVAALVSAAGGGLGVLAAFYDSAMGYRLARAALVSLLVSGVAITLPTIGFAWSTGYSTLPGVVLTEMAMVLLALVLGLVVAGEIVGRRQARQPARE